MSSIPGCMTDVMLRTVQIKSINLSVITDTHTYIEWHRPFNLMCVSCTYSFSVYVNRNCIPHKYGLEFRFTMVNFGGKGKNSHNAQLCMNMSISPYNAGRKYFQFVFCDITF